VISYHDDGVGLQGLCAPEADSKATKSGKASQLQQDFAMMFETGQRSLQWMIHCTTDTAAAAAAADCRCDIVNSVRGPMSSLHRQDVGAGC
jgi:hypothetical protein